MMTNDFLIAWLLTLALELPVIYLLLHKSAPRMKVLFAGFVASTLTLPWLWFVLRHWMDYNQLLLIGESLVVIIEAALLASWLQTRLRLAVPAAFLANLTSLLMGTWILSL
ncbi:hypothetical protein [Endozoicomonas arenosclerae]|uniref:hypothetical protein n=1 Tax=Endozoicomonas arenosclerae TaxID=1633495 RepID=UPI000B2F84D4|nr:hypothetical protein [Endozoicomonas arenosclerae]